MFDEIFNTDEEETADDKELMEKFRAVEVEPFPEDGDGEDGYKDDTDDDNDEEEEDDSPRTA